MITSDTAQELVLQGETLARGFRARVDQLQAQLDAAEASLVSARAAATRASQPIDAADKLLTSALEIVRRIDSLVPERKGRSRAVIDDARQVAALGLASGEPDEQDRLGDPEAAYTCVNCGASYIATVNRDDCRDCGGELMNQFDIVTTHEGARRALSAATTQFHLLESLKGTGPTWKVSRRDRQRFIDLYERIEVVQRWHAMTQPELQKEQARADSRVAEAATTKTHALEERAAIRELLHDALQFQTAVAARAPAWSDESWTRWTPPGRSLEVVPIGALVAKSTPNFRMPALLGPTHRRSLVVKASGAGRRMALASVESVALRLLASLPPADARFLFLDPVGLGDNAAEFIRLADDSPDLVGSKVYTEPHHIEQRLADLADTMETVIQQRLQRRYSSIEEYNLAEGELLAEPYRFVVAFDVPVNFSEASARRLISLAENGPRCGIYVLVVIDSDQAVPHGVNLADIERTSDVIAWDGKHFLSTDLALSEFEIQLDGMPTPPIVDRVIDCVGLAAKDAAMEAVGFSRIAPTKMWTDSSIDELSVPLGPAGGGKVQHLVLNESMLAHVVIAGRTGSGKSTLLHTIIASTALAYSPAEVEFYLVDFKKGVEFKTYADHRLPHARVIGIASEREFGVSVLHGIEREMEDRSRTITAEIDQRSLIAYRRSTGKQMSRIVLLVDEFQEFFTEEDSMAAEAARILDHLIRQGRSFGIHVVLASQTLAGNYSLPRSTLDQMQVRIALLCSEADSRLILADDNPAARGLSRPGEAIYNNANGMVDGNKRFQVALLTDSDRDEELKRVSETADERGLRLATKVFDGSTDALPSDNADLVAMLIRPPNSTTHRAQIWLGEPTALRPHTMAAFRTQTASNLLVIGSNGDAAHAILALAVLSLAAQVQPGGSVKVLDFGDVDAPHADVFPQLAKRFPDRVSIGRRRDLAGILEELATEVIRRLEADQPAARLFLILNGLHRARDLRQDDAGGFGYPSLGEEVATSDAQRFATILRDGPEVGVHILTWCDTANNLLRVVDRRLLREFAMRLVFQMSTDDSVTLIDSPAASKLGPHRALYYDEDAGQMEKLRPYSMPPPEWIDQQIDLIQDRSC